jgi:predicted amidohydrolase YtcJ
LNDRRPQAKHLDAVGVDRPAVAIGNYCHDCVLNSVALKKAGIDNETAIDTQPGVIYWDRGEKGSITGLAIEGQYAQAYIDIGAWQPQTMVPEAIDYLQGFLAASQVRPRGIPRAAIHDSADTAAVPMTPAESVAPFLIAGHVGLRL